MNIILILLSIAVGLGLPMVLIIKNKSTFNVKDFFLGILFYIIFRVIFYPFIANAISGTSLLAKLLIDFAYLVFITVFCKKIYITKLLKIDKHDGNKTVSFSIGETLIEFMLINMPNLLNLGAYYFMINFGNINEMLQGYSKLEIEKIVNIYTSISMEYYLFIFASIISLVIFNLYNNILLVKNYKHSIFLTIIFYLTYIVISVINKWIAILLLIFIIGLIYYMNKNKRVSE